MIIHKLSNNQKKQFNNQRTNVQRQRVLENVIRKQKKQVMLYTLIGDTKKSQAYKLLLNANMRKLRILIANNSYLSYDKNRLQVSK